MCQGLENDLLFNNGLIIENVSWVNNCILEYPKKCMLQIRHQHTPVECTIKFKKNFIVEFQEKVRSVAPGQSAVFYDNDICLGGGIITDTF